jgi:hypothetical protein
VASPSKEEIRTRANQLWKDAGEPEGQSDAFWYQAEKELLREGTETSAGKRGTESPAITEQLMEEVCGRENCKQALKRVKANKGSAGVDGMTVQ